MTFLIDPSGTIANVYVVTDAGAHPEAMLEELRQLTSPA
jgi:peroxiredoxin